MSISKQEKVILYALGIYHNCAAKKFSNLEPRISKAIFIDLLTKSKIVNKKQRALYKNLEDLEDKNMITYSTNSLKLTKKGHRVFCRILKDISSYISITNNLTERTFTNARKLQTSFKR